MKFKVNYMKPKKKGYYSQQVATFYDERDALNWEHHIRKNGCKEIVLLGQNVNAYNFEGLRLSNLILEI